MAVFIYIRCDLWYDKDNEVVNLNGMPMSHVQSMCRVHGMRGMCNR